MPACRETMTEDRMHHLLALLEGERERDRASIDRLERLAERQGRLLEACRQRLGREAYEQIRALVEQI